MRLALAFILGVMCSTAHAFCFDDASVRYDVPVSLLKTIARVESRMNPAAINTNGNGSRDIGLMQINTDWLPVLRRYGISREDLWDPCTNVRVGAWIMAKNIETYGYTWEAIGAYNARSPEKRMRYAKRVFAEVFKGGLR